MQNFCFEEAGQTLNKLKTSANGLALSEAAARLETYGRNRLEQSKKAGFFKLFFSQFKDFMTLLLIAQ